MAKIRVFIEKNIKIEGEIVLTKSQSHYLKNVMRKKEGEELFAFNGHDGEWLAKISFTKKEVKLIPINQTRKVNENLNLDIWICFGVIKPKNISYLVEKTTEIGVRKIIPLNTEFSENIKLNYSRLDKIAIEATEQSENMIVPKIEELINLEDLIKKIGSDRKIIMCDEKEKNNSILKVLKKNSLKKLAIFIGPVGGWSKNDKREFLKKKKVLFVSLGNSLLKADTAAIYALSCITAQKDS
ncbi:16S rRNA (uracil(1498)-N(3))-methyltransferase [Rickettsiales bacterium]|nr:16S rRNA (uracil(1498)-N(3))-methyltransferase [Rickettsiales bacterium]